MTYNITLNATPRHGHPGVVNVSLDFEADMLYTAGVHSKANRGTYKKEFTRESKRYTLNEYTEVMNREFSSKTTRVVTVEIHHNILQ